MRLALFAFIGSEKANHGAAVLLVKGLLGKTWVPWGICFQESIEDD